MTKKPDTCEGTAYAVDALIAKWASPADGDTQEILREAMRDYHETRRCCDTHGTHVTPHVGCVLR